MTRPNARVRIIGSCSPDEVEELRRLIDAKASPDFGPLCAITGPDGAEYLDNWAAETFDVVGKLADWNHTADDVREHLERLRDACPSLEIDAHVSGKDVDDVVATVELRRGRVRRRAARRARLRGR